MSMTLDISPEKELLRVKATGKFSLEEAKMTFLEILHAIIQYQTKKVLFDGRELIGEPQTMERFYYGEFAAMETNKLLKRGVSSVPQFAYVLIPPVLDERRFGENVATNRGMYVKTFDNPEEAFGWLGF